MRIHENLCNLNFADDIDLLNYLTDCARYHLVAQAEGANRVCLRINMDKTQRMATPSLPQDIVIPNLGTLEQVECFKYLGSFMSSSAADLNARGGQTWGPSGA